MPAWSPAAPGTTVEGSAFVVPRMRRSKLQAAWPCAPMSSRPDEVVEPLAFVVGAKPRLSMPLGRSAFAWRAAGAGGRLGLYAPLALELVKHSSPGGGMLKGLSCLVGQYLD